VFFFSFFLVFFKFNRGAAVKQGTLPLLAVLATAVGLLL
jgi:hypothetical protein